MIYLKAVKDNITIGRNGANPNFQGHEELQAIQMKGNV